MSLDLIPYQPLPFGLEENCTLPCYEGWMQKVQGSTDTISVQFRYGACSNTNSETIDGNFTGSGVDWIQGGAWTFPDTRAVSPIGGAGYIRQAIANASGLYYELTFTIVVNNGLMLLNFSDGTVIPYSASGTYTYTFESDGKTYVEFFFNAALGGTVANVIMKPILTRVHDALFMSDGTLVGFGDASGVATYNNGFLTLNYNSDLPNFPDGCYYFGIYDPCQCSQFGFAGDDFQSQAQWDVYEGGDDLIVITGGVMQASALGTSSHYVRRRFVLCRDVAYTITFTIADMEGTDTFQFRAGTTNGTVYTTDGTYTEVITPAFTNDDPLDLRFIFELDITNPHFVLITDFSIEAVTPIMTYRSVDFDLRNTICECTVLVSACGNGDQFNMGFVGTGFNPSIRLASTLRTSNYPTTREAYEFSTGQKKTTYMRTRKARSFAYGAPEYVHDFMRLTLGFDNVYLDGRASFCEDEEPPSISWSDEVDFGVATYTFSDAVELTEKRPCADGAPLGCSTDGIALEVNVGLQRPILETVDGRTINTSKQV
jgi:hypothetical protein